MGVSLRSEMASTEALSLPPLALAYQRGMKNGKRYTEYSVIRRNVAEMDD
jgi:hypothetical protein